MANAKHRTPEHRAARAEMAAAMAAGVLPRHCAQPVCLMRTRWIAVDAEWDAAHDRRGGYYGPAHVRCNRSAGAIDGLRARGFKSSRRTAQTRRDRPRSRGSWSSRDW